MQFPYRTGITDRPYAEEPWIIGQYSGFSDPASTNRRFRELVAKGQQGLAIALDLPTQLGLDPDDPQAYGEVGRVGVSLSSLADMEALFDGIPLDSVRQISTTANSIGPMMIALLLALAEQRGVDPATFSVRLQNDVLKEYVARGTQIWPVDVGVEVTVDAIEYCIRHLPGWVPISISGYHMRDAGATRERELAFTLANARTYLEGVRQRGIEPDAFASQVTWFLSSSSQPIEEAAKFRAARELWATMLRDEFDVIDEAAQKLRIIAYTLGSELLPTEILNNSVRVTLSALAAVLGGVQVLFCSSIDEALGLPTDEHALLSMRTQQILLEESGIARYVDVLGGAPAVEELTTAYVDAARSIDAELRDRGGVVASIADEWMRDQIDEDAWIAHREQPPRIGAVPDAAGPRDIFEPDPNAESNRVATFRSWRAQRDATAIREALDEVGRALGRGENLVPSLKAAYLAGASLGETCNVITERHGRLLEGPQGVAAHG